MTREVYIMTKICKVVIIVLRVIPRGLSLYAVFTLTLQIEDEAHKKYQYIVQELGYAYACIH